MDFLPVSVIVCTRNRAELLPGVLSMLRAQDYPSDMFEIIVVDNGSSDDTAAVVDRVANSPGHPIRYVFESRPGITFARNRGTAEAHYPYVANCDDDCRVNSDWLQKLMTGFNINPNVAAVGGLVLLAWSEDRPSWMSSELEPYIAATSFLGGRSRILEKTERIFELNMAIEGAALEEAGGFFGMEQFGSKHLAAGEGYYLQHQLHNNGKNIAFVHEAVMYHHPAGRATRSWMIRRTFWSGVSFAILEDLQSELPKKSVVHQISVHFGLFLTHLIQAGLYLLRNNDNLFMLNLSNASAYVGRLLGEIHAVGDWQQVQFTKQNRESLEARLLTDLME